MHGIHASDLQHLKVARWGHRLKLLDIDPSSVTVTACLDFFIGDEGDGRWSEAERRWFFEGDIEALVKELPEYKKTEGCDVPILDRAEGCFAERHEPCGPHDIPRPRSHPVLGRQ